MKSTVYGNRLPRGRQVKKRLGNSAIGDRAPANYSFRIEGSL